MTGFFIPGSLVHDCGHCHDGLLHIFGRYKVHSTVLCCRLLKVHQPHPNPNTIIYLHVFTATGGTAFGWGGTAFCKGETAFCQGEQLFLLRRNSLFAKKEQQFLRGGTVSREEQRFCWSETAFLLRRNRLSSMLNFVCTICNQVLQYGGADMLCSFGYAIMCKDLLSQVCAIIL